jgi:carbamoyl-phosphate synthase large subunit
MTMNVLLTCVGRRTPVVAAFKDAVKGHERVLACDSSADAPALGEAHDGFVVPPIDDERYIDALVRICGENQVGLLVPALEPELALLAKHHQRFLEVGTRPVVSSADVVAICYDKLATDRFLESCGLSVPHTFDSLDAAREAVAEGKASFPLIVKPRWGVSSIGTHEVHDDEELDLALRLTQKQIARTLLGGISATDPARCVLIQERLPGQEFGLDVVNDLDGRNVCAFAKRKLRMWAGQTDRAVSVDHPRLEALGRLIGEKLGHVGLLDCDVFATEQDAWVIDLNPRLGGGYPFSHSAGANYPAALLAWAKGEVPDPRWLRIRPGVTTSRCDRFITQARRPE